MIYEVAKQMASKKGRAKYAEARPDQKLYDQPL
jgi:hypothetical protein